MARGDVLLVSLPPSDRREQSGRRPAVAVQTDDAGEPMLMIAPVTSNLAALRFGLRQIGAVLELVESAVRRDRESSHAIMGALYSVVT